MRRSRALNVGLLMATVVTSGGWLLEAHEGGGQPPHCYTLEAARILGVSTIHGVAAERVTFVVEEEPDRVMVGYWSERRRGPSTAEGYPAGVSYVLVHPLGDRPVVDPAGEPIRTC